MRLKLPSFILAVIFAKAPIKLARNAADRSLVPDIGCAQSSTAQSTKMLAKFGNPGALAHARCLNRRSDAAGCPAVNADVRFDDCGCGAGITNRDEQANLEPFHKS